jgi:DNA invertase Pin-like site-specific DNA recombinase/HAMP domain-containing protein
MNNQEKILPEHRERTAFIYARQSTYFQVMHNSTSTERQVGLVDLALTLGWERSRVELVTSDLGRSGKFSENRDGFQKLAADMGLGRVGAVFSLDASRLARSSADWHRLLEIAALTRTLIIDEQTVYDPREANDRLVLGMKGTMADFELVWLRQRMEGGKWHLARKGEYEFRPPVGYVRDEDGHLVFDPNEEVKRAVDLLFERYRVSGSCREVARYFADHGIRVPARFGDRVTWIHARPARLGRVLHNPIYAGAYVYGRGRSETVLEEGRRRVRRRPRPMADWPVVIKSAHAGYISWEEFVANQKRMKENTASFGPSATRGAPREGHALLQGLLLCGRCNDHCAVRYVGQNGRYAHYCCSAQRTKALGDRCFHMAARYIEEPVIAFLFSVLTREQLVAATEVLDLVERQTTAIDEQWRLRLERARYEARRAERQYEACEPENRVVARTLETRWNQKLTEVEQLEKEFAELTQRERIALSELERRRILELASNLPKLWADPAISARDRKMLLRLLIADVSVNLVEVPHRLLRIRILWHTRAVSELAVGPVPHRNPKDRRPLAWRLVRTSNPDVGKQAV